jgi:hypothetical protein
MFILNYRMAKVRSAFAVKASRSYLMGGVSWSVKSLGPEVRELSVQ